MAMTAFGSLLEALRRSVPASERRRRLGNVVARWARDRGGASAIIFGLALPAIVGFVGLGVETAFWYLEKREHQEAPDSTALAGAREFATNGATPTVTETVAATAVTKSGFSGITYGTLVGLVE